MRGTENLADKKKYKDWTSLYKNCKIAKFVESIPSGTEDHIWTLTKINKTKSILHNKLDKRRKKKVILTPNRKQYVYLNKIYLISNNN